MATKALELSTFKADGNGGIILRAYAEGRFWPIWAGHAAVTLHAQSCTRCDWTFCRGMIVLCTPGLRLSGLF